MARRWTRQGGVIVVGLGVALRGFLALISFVLMSRIGGDLLLIYVIKKSELILLLVDIGTHSDFF